MYEEKISARSLEELRGRISRSLSAERFAHTEGVAQTAAKMAFLYTPDAAHEIEAAAYLHDITKEYSLEKQLKICSEFGIIPRDDEAGVPAVLHAITAASIIPVEYPEFATETVISSVRWHTTGRAGMSLPEKIIFLADYIEEGRKYPDCIAAREFFNSVDLSALDEHARLAHLDSAILMAIDATLNHLRRKGGLINSDTLAARNYLLERRV